MGTTPQAMLAGKSEELLQICMYVFCMYVYVCIAVDMNFHHQKAFIAVEQKLYYMNRRTKAEASSNKYA